MIERWCPRCEWLGPSAASACPLCGAATLDVESLERLAAPSPRVPAQMAEPASPGAAAPSPRPPSASAEATRPPGFTRLIALGSAVAVVAGMWAAGRLMQPERTAAPNTSSPPGPGSVSVVSIRSSSSSTNAGRWYIPPLRVMTYHDAIWIAYHPKWYAKALRHQREAEAERRAQATRSQPPPLGLRRPAGLR